MKPKSKNFLTAAIPARLILSFGLAAAGFASRAHADNTWDGGGTAVGGLWNWSDSTNWGSNTAPTLPGALTFSGIVGLFSNNDLTLQTINGFTFNSGAGAFVLSGNAITLGGNITNSSTSLQTINLAMASTTDRTVTTATGGGDITLAGLISGAGGIVKSGNGTLTLSGANTYTGNTTISAGTLKNGSSTTFNNNGALILNGTGTFDLNGFDATFSQEGGSLAANTIINNGAADATLKISDDQFGSYAGLLKDGPTNKLAVSLSNPNRFKTFLTNTGNTFSGGLTLLNNAAGGTRLSITQAITTVGSPGAIVSSTYGTGAINIGQVNTDRAGILINIATTLPNAIVFNTALGNDFAGIRLAATGIVLSGAITANSNAAFSGDTAGNSANVSGAISGAGGVVMTSVGTLTLSGTNTYAGATTISAGTLTASGGSAITNTSAVTLANISGATLNLATSETIGSLAGGGATGGNVTLGSTTLTTGGDNSTTSFAGVISGTGAMTKTGTGAMTLTGTNTYTGTTTVSGGTLTHAGSSTGTLGAISVAGTGTTQMNIQAGSYTLGNVGFFVGNTAGNGIVNQSGGAVTWNNASLQLLIGNNGGAGTYNLSGGSLTLFANGSGNRGIVLGVSANTTATFNLSGSGTISDSGVLQIGRSENTSGTNGTTNLFTQTGGTATVANLTMGGNGTTIGTGISATLNLTGGTFSATSFTSNAAANTNTSAITIGGTAQVTLPAFPTVRGTGSTATITLDSTTGGGGFLAPTAASAAYMPAGSFTHAYLTANGANFNVASGKDITVAQVLENNTGAAGALTKTGVGTLTLSGTNTYTGTTTINAGILAVNGSITSSVTVNSGGTLGGSGTITGGLTVKSGGTHAAGNSPGLETVTGNVSYESGSIFAWDLAANKDSATGTRGTDYDAVNFGGTLDVAAGAFFRVIQNGGVDFSGTFWDTARVWNNIFSVTGATTSGWANNAVSVYNTSGVLQDVSVQGSFTVTGTTLSWSAVPEPSSAVAGLVLGAGLLRRRRAGVVFTGSASSRS